MTSAAVKLALPLHEEQVRAPRRLPLLPVAALLDAQRSLTAVERFSELHDEGQLPSSERVYRSRIPLERPKINQQYAFEVDLDACTGCKACVSGCHTLNGLDDTEAWRTVGFLHGGTTAAPALQTVTTSCHHCLEPACLSGCPVKAYEKDPVTGIVKHLDDQCIGCQYCTLMCPYDAPKFNKARGIVRKCDMCSSRLDKAEEPACVQACPNGAIAIRTVEKSAVVESSQGNGFLPGAPAAEHTLPSTIYKTKKAMAPNMLPADFYHSSPEHSHPPLVIMLTLTQLSVGAFALTFTVERFFGQRPGGPLAQTVFACTLAVIALAASVFHLGRPWLAWRVFLGLRTSWLSREAIAFGVFAKLGVLYGVLTLATQLRRFPGKEIALAAAPSVQAAAAFMGILGVFFSVMVYVATRRLYWSGLQTGFKFFATMTLLGASSVLFVHAATRGTVGALAHGLLSLVMVVAVAKLGFESRVFAELRNRRHSAGKRVALLLTGDLASYAKARYGFGILGGVLLPLVARTGLAPLALATVCGLSLLALTAGELLERYLFFRAAPASRMPGGLQ